MRDDLPPIIPPKPPIPGGVLHGKVIIVLRRVSGAGQVGNSSSGEQDAVLTRYVHSLGGGVLPMDENAPPGSPEARAMSGRDLAKREVAKWALDLIDEGVAHGLSWYDVKRLSRDEFNVDPNVIIKRLAARRAVLVTHNAIVRPWDKEDRFRFHIDAALAGRDVMDIRDTFFRGIFYEAAKRPFFGSVPAVGYATVLREERGDGPTRVKRDPVKNPDHAALMSDLVRWMDECVAAVDVAARVNRTYHQLVGQRGDRRRRRRGLEGAAVWSAQNLAYILKNPKYWGDWGYGAGCDKTNTVWDDDERRRLAESGHYRHSRPDLAYWTRERATAWREKFARPPGGDGAPWSRRPKHPHPLLGVLSCAHCGAPMIAFGSERYICHLRGTGVCPKPGIVTEAVARRVLRGMLPGLLANLQGLEEAIRRESAGEDAGLVKLRRTVATRRAQVDAVDEEYYPDDAPPKAMPSGLRVKWERWQRELDELGPRLEAAEQAAGAGVAARQEWVALLSGDPVRQLARFDHLPEAQQAAVYRELVRGVRITGAGSGPARVHTVEGGWEEPLRDRLLARETPWSEMRYPPTLTPLAVA